MYTCFSITGGNIILGRAGIRTNKFSNLTIQDGGILDLITKYGDERDIWNLEVAFLGGKDVGLLA